MKSMPSLFATSPKQMKKKNELRSTTKNVLDVSCHQIWNMSDPIMTNVVTSNDSDIAPTVDADR